MSSSSPAQADHLQLPRPLAEFMAHWCKLTMWDRVAARYAQRVEESPNDLWALLYLAEFHYRKRRWRTAVEYASRSISLSPHSFQALMIISSSYGHLGELDKALPYARSLLAAHPPRWTLTKCITIVVFMPLLLFPSKRARLQHLLRKCDQERAAELAHVSWARGVVESNSPAAKHVAA